MGQCQLDGLNAGPWRGGLCLQPTGLQPSQAEFPCQQFVGGRLSPDAGVPCCNSACPWAQFHCLGPCHDGLSTSPVGLPGLGLEFGSTMKARELFRLIFEKVPSTQEICQRNNPCPSVWWDGCGESNLKQGNASYEKGRRELLDQFARLEASDRGG